MATIIQHVDTEIQYVLVGAGFGMFQSKKPHWFFGNLVYDVDSDQSAMVCVCNAEGKIGWLDSSEVVVVSVDGQPVEELFPSVD